MLAVRARVYTPAYLLWSLAEDVCTGNDQVNMADMVYPQHAASAAHAVAEDELLSPLAMLCRSDPCTFTYTGDSHIRQDIFECRTCGLTGTLCCCTECALTCHQGHECK
jgi:E3 ubiquitin-protein ligase EDD1